MSGCRELAERCGIGVADVSVPSAKVVAVHEGDTDAVRAERCGQVTHVPRQVHREGPPVAIVRRADGLRDARQPMRVVEPAK